MLPLRLTPSDKSGSRIQNCSDIKPKNDLIYKEHIAARKTVQTDEANIMLYVKWKAKEVKSSQQPA